MKRQLIVSFLALLIMTACENPIITIPRNGGGIDMAITAYVNILEKTSVLPTEVNGWEGIQLIGQGYQLTILNINENPVPTLSKDGVLVDLSTECHTTADYIECSFGAYKIQYRLAGID